MKVGDLIKISFGGQAKVGGHGIYLGVGKRNTKSGVAVVYWKGRIATFDQDLWDFTVLCTPDK